MKKQSIRKKIPDNILSIWPSLVLGAVLLFVISGLLWFQLGSLLPGLSLGESALQARVSANEISLRNLVLENPIYLPFSFGLYILQLLSLDSAVAIRSIGAFFGLLSVVAVFFIVKRWHTLRVTLLTTLLYATSAGFLHTARLADERSVFLLLPVVFALALYARNIKKSWLQILLYMAGFILLLYVPGGIWFIVLLILWQRKRLVPYIKKLSVIPLILFSVLGIALVSLLAFAFALNPSQIYLWLGASTVIPSSGELVTNLLTTVSHLFIRGPADPVFWVGITPLLDALLVVLFLLGCYVGLFQRKLERTKVLFSTIGILVLLSVFGGPVTAFAVIPFMYIIAASGLALLLQQWFTVFPRNPFARSIGVGLIIVTVAFSVLYNAHRYYVVWPKTPQVHESFQQQAED